VTVTTAANAVTLGYDPAPNKGVQRSRMTLGREIDVGIGAPTPNDSFLFEAWVDVEVLVALDPRARGRLSELSPSGHAEQRLASADEVAMRRINRTRRTILKSAGALTVGLPLVSFAQSTKPSSSATKPSARSGVARQFPRGFYWGTGTASYQIEGA